MEFSLLLLHFLKFVKKQTNKQTKLHLALNESSCKNKDVQKLSKFRV